MEVSGRKRTENQRVDTDVHCEPCKKDNKTKMAYSYCTNCDEFFCESCSTVHKYSKISSHHRLLDDKVMPTTKLASLYEKYCHKHDRKQIEYFCKKHDNLCCSVCVKFIHTQCEVEHVDSLAQGFNSSREYRELRKRKSAIENQLSDIRKNTQKNLIAVKRNYNHLIADIEQFRTEINSKLDKLEQQVTKEALKIQTEDLTSLQSITSTCIHIQTELNGIISAFETLEKYNQNQQLVIHTIQANTKINEYRDQLEEMSPQYIARNYSFRSGTEILKILKSCDYLGSLEIDTNEGNEKGQDKGEDAMAMIPEYVQPTFVGKINIQHKQDVFGRCWISGSVLMNDDTVVLIDRNNYSVKVVDLHTDTLVSCIRLTVEPWDLTCIDPNTLVVTSNRNLQYLGYDGKMTLIKNVQMEPGCTGIAYNNNKLFVTFIGDEPAVRILDKDGNIYETFKTDNQGQRLFQKPQYIAVSTDGQSIYVSDWNNHTVTCLNIQGGVVGRYNHEDLRGPMGLAVDSNNTIYIVGNASHNIHRMTSRCEPIQIVSLDREWLEYPITLLYNNRSEMMYIGRYDKWIHVCLLDED